MEMSGTETVITTKEISVDGKTFVSVTDRTFEQDLYLMDQVRAAGLDNIAALLGPDRPLEEIAHDILAKVFASGRTFQLLAGMLVEKGTVWAPETVDHVARFFATRTRAEDKVVLQEVLVSLVLAFFLNGVARTRTSLSSFTRESSATPSQPETGSPGARPASVTSA